ncbi:MAG TPA: D-alanyl-D-alanine carboxypeptidase [Puia sp.]|jgi:D-alanyl-D-alanine carboxypeptidase/D-alanyl-D-alanine-endopeptidase (penicillin-binding protein 4)
MRLYTGLALILVVVFSQACSPAHSIQSGQPAAGGGKTASRTVPTLTTAALDEMLKQPGLESAQVGVCLYDPSSSTFKVNYQGDKYFIPASNTKLFSLYAGMKYLGDSLVGMRWMSNDTALFIIPSGDPTFLHPSFPDQPVVRFLQHVRQPLYLANSNWMDKPLGRGWAWDDYNDDYMSERSAFPVYGNLIRWVSDSLSASFYSIPDINWPVRFSTDTTKQIFHVQRDFTANAFEITEGKGKTREQDVPFITDGGVSAAVLLKDTVGREVRLGNVLPGSMQMPKMGVVHSRPVDSMFRPMMYNSDNFFAEQTLLMVSNQLLGKMNDSRIIDTLLKTDLKDLPQHPIWVDGCGLSRNDLFTPQDFIWLLNKSKNEFGLDRMKRILPTGGKGTLASYYRQDSGYIFAKTGSLSGVVALSGYLITQKDHLLLFSILINNYTGSGVTVRRQMEQLIHTFRSNY